MATRQQPDTRDRILDAARELFAAQGYQRTSLRQIAARLGVTKAAVLYHFPAKDQILTALTEPLFDDMERALDSAAHLPPEQATWSAIEAVLDVFLAHSKALQMMRHDMAMLDRQPEVYHRFIDFGERAYRIVAGPDAGLVDLVRASQVFAGLSEPVVFFPDAPVESLREVILEGSRRTLGIHAPDHNRNNHPVDDHTTHNHTPNNHRADAPDRTPSRAVSSNARGRGAPGAGRLRAGRPRALDATRLAEAKSMLAAGKHTVAEIAAAVGVSRATLYRHLER